MVVLVVEWHLTACGVLVEVARKVGGKPHMQLEVWFKFILPLALRNNQKCENKPEAAFISLSTFPFLSLNFFSFPYTQADAEVRSKRTYTGYTFKIRDVFLRVLPR